MDTVNYSDSRQVGEKTQADVKTMRHLPSWILLPLFLFTSCTYARRPCDSNDTNTTVTACVGGNACFRWDYEVRPFYLVGWYFEDIQIAETLEDYLSQDSLSINENYKDRFELLKNGYIGFNMTNVTETDRGTYKCILNLIETSIPMEFEKTLNFTDPVEQKSPCSEDEQPPTTREEEQPPASDSRGTANHVAVAVSVPVVIVVIVVVVVFVVIKRKRKSTGENQYVRSEAEPRSEFESRELVEQKDKIKSPAENGEESQDLVENKEA